MKQCMTCGAVVPLGGDSPQCPKKPPGEVCLYDLDPFNNPSPNNLFKTTPEQAAARKQFIEKADRRAARSGLPTMDSLGRAERDEYGRVISRIK